MKSPADYLTIHPADGSRLRGLHWSGDLDAVEDGEGRTFATVGEVLLFLEGFAAQRPLMHFSHVLHFFFLLRHGEAGTLRSNFNRLGKAWRDAGRPARTAGAFCAVLCREVPPVSDPPSAEDLRAWRGVWAPLVAWRPSAQEEPALGPQEFNALLHVALDAYTDAGLVHWFRHAQAPADPAGDDRARVVLAAKPPTLDAVLAEVSRHDRLAGAVPFVSRLVSALTLPPRRLSDRELPLGGYADVTTRGGPEQILPGQFALDELEFLRRYAERELLYYRREEPASRTREELVVLLDQGVRTWGAVRLVLAAAVFALGRLAGRRGLPLLLAGTSDGGVLLDPLAGPAEGTAGLLAASDLTAHPGPALEAVLTDQAAGRRDVVLLTHPRSLAEPDVLAAALTAGANHRLFAVAVDGRGEVGFHEIRHGAPVTLGRFRLELETLPAGPPPDAAGAWKGDCREPVGFPFRFGLAGSHERCLFAFDQAGEWLLTASQFGMLCAARCDGAGHEILPRCVVGGRVLADVHQVLGVSGGFVVAGATSAAQGTLAAAHYDFAAREVRCHTFSLGPHLPAGGIEWRYARGPHLLLLRAGGQFQSVELATGRRADVPPRLQWASHRPETRDGCTTLLLPPQDFPGAPHGWPWPRVSFTPDTGTLVMGGFTPGWEVFVPQEDGRPALKGLSLHRAECSQDVLAAVFANPAGRKKLWVFRGPSGQVVFSFLLGADRDGFALSPCGRLLAVQRGSCQLAVHSTRPGETSQRRLTPVGRFHNNAVVVLGDGWLAVAIDRTVHLVRWGSGRLEPSLLVKGGLPAECAGGTRATPGRLPDWVKYDAARFRQTAERGLVAVVDAYGEVFLFTRAGVLLAAFFAFRQALAAWTPQGDGWGAESLLGRPATADADRRIGRLLLESEGEEAMRG
jgi:hypothetical protein